MKNISYTFVLALLIGCTPFKLSVSDDLKAAHDEYEVKGKDGIMIKQKLTFGEFTTEKVKRSWTKGTSGRFGIGSRNTPSGEWENIISVEYINKKQTLNFSLTDGQLNSEVFCVSKFNSKDLQLGPEENSILNIGIDLFGAGYSSTSTYYVQVYTGNDGKPWQLLLDNQQSQMRSKSYVGYFAKNRNEYYTIHPASKIEKNGKSGSTLLGAVGFEIHDQNGRAVAAVSLMNKGMVFLGKTTREERFLMANVCAALLLQQHIDE
jgi:hypothetical protein